MCKSWHIIKSYVKEQALRNELVTRDKFFLPLDVKNLAKKRVNKLWQKILRTKLMWELWVLENSKLLFFYLEHAPLDLNLLKQDETPFTLGIQTIWQSEMIAKFGHGMSQPYFGQVWGWSPTLEKSEDLESSETPECLEFDRKAQNTSHWGVLAVIGKVLKRRYRKWPRIGHLDIYSPSYGQKKGRESNWQFDSRPLKFGNRPLPDIRLESATRRWKELDEGYNFGSDLVAIWLFSWELWAPKVPGLHLGQFRDSNLGVPGKRATSM